MANVGDQLTQPEAGWRRYDDTYPSIRFTNATVVSSSSRYGGSYRAGTGMTAKFLFKGTKIRIIATSNQEGGHSRNVKVNVDGIDHYYDNAPTSIVIDQIIVFELLNLSDREHFISINGENQIINIDAIDIDFSGELLSIPPPTTGKLCNTLDEMVIGDYIIWKRDGNTHSFGGDISGFTELPVTGVASSSLPTKYFHYAIKVDTGLLISDRVTEHTISWDTLNSQKRIQGLPVIISSVSGVIRSLTGGVAYADENGNMSFNATGSKGCFPINNEYDKYINNFPLSMTQTGKTLDDVWHYLFAKTWTQDTPLAGDIIHVNGTTSTIPTSPVRTARGLNLPDTLKDFTYPSTTLAQTATGFRPVFEWREV